LISFIGVLFGTMAMVIVLSVFNGFDDIIHELYKNVDSDFKIELKEGALFSSNHEFVEYVKNIDGVIAVSEVLEHKMLVESKSEELLVVDAKGVDSNYLDVNNIEENIWTGNYFYTKKNHLLISNHLSNVLGAHLLDYENPLKLSFFQKKLSPLGLDNLHQFHRSFYVAGVFQTYTEFDNTYVILDISDLRDFLFLNNSCSSLEIKIKDAKMSKRIEKELKHLGGDEFLIHNRFNQRPFIYKMVETEKLAVYIIFSFILIISMLSLIASLAVLLMEKQEDIYILHAFGVTKQNIKNIFFLTGFFITILGSLTGTVLGRLLCYLQDNLKIIKLGESSSFIQAYPVKVEIIDIIMIQCIVLLLGTMTAYLVSRNEKFYQH